MYSESLEKDGKLTPHVVCFISLEHFQMKSTLPIYVLQSVQGHLFVAQSFSFSLNIPSAFAFLMLLRISFNILGGKRGYALCSKARQRFLSFCSFGSFFELFRFCIKWKVSFIILAPKSFFFIQISVARICKLFSELSRICSFQ